MQCVYAYAQFANTTTQPNLPVSAREPEASSKVRAIVQCLICKQILIRIFFRGIQFPSFLYHYLYHFLSCSSFGDEAEVVGDDEGDHAVLLISQES